MAMINNNNFGRLTANASINNKLNLNKTNAEKETAKTAQNNIPNSLNIGTLKDGVGTKFDSEKIADLNTPAPQMAKTSGKSWGDYIKKHWDLRGGVENYTGKGADEMGFSVLLTGTVDWAVNTVIGWFK